MDALRPLRQQDDTAPSGCENLASYLQVQERVPSNLTHVLSNPRPQWYIVDGQPTLAFVLDIIDINDILAQAMALAGAPMQQQQSFPQLQPEPPEGQEPTDSHEVAADRILRYLEAHQPTLPNEEGQRRPSAEEEQEDQKRHRGKYSTPTSPRSRITSTPSSPLSASPPSKLG